MKKNQFIQLFAIAAVSGFCISGNQVRQDNAEAAKSTKAAEESQAAEVSGQSCTHKAHRQSIKVRSAARKVVEGSSNTSSNSECKSAARKAMEAEAG